MAKASLENIKALRDRTGAGMLDVKKALEEADNDLDKALELIRIKGLKGVSKREGRDASDGLVVGKVVDAASGQAGVLVEIASETDFVAKSDPFVALAARVLDVAVASEAADLEALLQADVEGKTLAEFVVESSATLGEKVEVKKLARIEAPAVAIYLHSKSQGVPPQLGVLVGTDAAGAGVGRDIATHISFAAPGYLTEEDVPSDVLASESRIAEEIAREEGKPEAILPKIVEGRLKGFLKEAVLLNQPFAKDNKKTISEVLKEAGASVTTFARFSIGS